MAVHCGCCVCSKRIAVMVIGVISTVHFLLESAAVVAVGSDHGSFRSPQTTPYFYAMVGAQLFMALVSVLLGIGACVNIFWLCVPWLFMTLLNLLYHAYILLFLIVKMISNFDLIKMEMFIFIIFSGVLLIYMDGIVGSFVHDLIKNDKNKPKPNRYDEEEYRPLIKDN